MLSSKEFYTEGSTENISKLVKETKTRSFQFSPNNYKQMNFKSKKIGQTHVVEQSTIKNGKPHKLGLMLV